MNVFFIQLCLLFLITLVGSFLLTRWLIPKLTKFGIVDHPCDRRIHNVSTPRGGGLSIAIVTIIMSCYYEYFVFETQVGIIKIIILFSLISFISFLDDIKTVSVIVRFLIHIVCVSSAIYIYLYPNIFLQANLINISYFIIATIALTAFLNIYNFLDGIDGITAIETIHLSITILCLSYLKYDTIENVNLVLVIGLIILACSISFLVFNWYPARVFIGDVGSIGLGFLLGFSLILIGVSSFELFFSVIISSMYYLADGGLTILIRLFNGEKVWQAHLKHFFQQALKNGMTNQQIIKHVIACNLCLFLLAITSLYYPIISLAFAIISVAITLTKFKYA